MFHLIILEKKKWSYRYLSMKGVVRWLVEFLVLGLGGVSFFLLLLVPLFLGVYSFEQEVWCIFNIVSFDCFIDWNVDRLQWWIFIICCEVIYFVPHYYYLFDLLYVDYRGWTCQFISNVHCRSSLHYMLCSQFFCVFLFLRSWDWALLSLYLMLAKLVHSMLIGEDKDDK